MGKRVKKRKRRTEIDILDIDPFHDETFFYIAGYTSGGAPYGITWEEAAAQGILTEEEMEGRFLK